MEASPYHIFQVKGEDYVIHAERLTTGSVPKSIFHGLTDNALNDPVSGEFAACLRSVEVVRPRDLAHIPAFFYQPVQELILLLTLGCNLRCVYCFGADATGSAKPMARNTAFQSVDWLIGQSGALKELSLKFFGGEPLLEFSLFKKIVHYARKRALIAGKKINFSVTTNGTLLDDAKIRFLRENRITPTVSFDGLRQAQDGNRPFKDGSGSYDTVLPKLKKLLSVIPQADCNAVIWGKTDPAAVQQALSRIGFAVPNIEPVSPCLSGRRNPDTGRHRNLAALSKLEEQESDQLLADIRNRRTQHVKQCHQQRKLFRILLRFLGRQRTYFPCAAGRGRLAVVPNGDLYACQRLVYHEAFRLGSVFEGVFDRQAYFTIPDRSSGACSRCFAKYLCGGGCLYDNLAMTGSAAEPSPDFCRMVQRRAELAAAIVCRLRDSDIAYLDEAGIMPRRHRIFELDFEVLQGQTTP